MKAVVTGSAGFIGSHLVDELIARGCRITGIDRRPEPDAPGYSHHLADLADDPYRNGLSRVIADADVVFHLAAQPGVRGGGPAIEKLRRRDNVIATRNLLAVTPPITPVIATSSSSVYGGSRNGAPSREVDPLRPRGGYARSKVAMEALCEARRAAGGVITVIRPFTVAGERQRPDMAFSLWFAALRRGEPIRIFGSESRSRDVTDVRHVVEGLLRAWERGVSETVNLGTGVGHRLIDLALALLDVSGLNGDIVLQPVPADDVDATLADTARCRRLLGFVPETDLRGLLGRQIDAVLSQRALVAL